MSSMLGWLPVITMIALVLNGFRLRGQLGWLPVLDDEEPGPHGRFQFVVAEGAVLPERTRAAAEDWARRQGLAVLDLIPGDLGVPRALDLARAGLGKDFLANRLAVAGGAGHALLVAPRVAEREELTADPDTVTTAGLTARLKRLACTATDFAVAPGLGGLPESPAQRAARLRAERGMFRAVLPPLVCYAALLTSVVAQPILGLGALALFSLQPYLVFASSPIRPADLHRQVALRLLRDPANWARTLAALWRTRTRGDRVADLRAAYAAELAQGTERFFESRRPDCPWCGSDQLSPHVRCADLVLNKPGRFTLERCAGCGHVFQNPRLNLAGLDFYYRDCYDGEGARTAETAFSSGPAVYRRRAEMLAPFTTPKTWLDVGGGHGHFANLAREVWPETAFDGLDLGAGIEEAARRGWVDRGYRGQFPELAAELAGRYDVLSMFHYLEHTREPFEELDAAAKVLSAGGFLLIEVPNPASRYGRLLRTYWMPWFPPQHQHMIPRENLVRALTERGFAVVAQDRGRADQSMDLTMALALGLNRLARNPNQPWRPAPATWWRRARYRVIMLAGAPLLVLSWLTDKLAHQVIKRGNGGNAYRVLAQRAG
ncbi:MULTISPECIES: class I SAM-dependent methyltransferase [unclassified Crossiella]|uniref:class I SAM-dependent methyltransferase n=1 Tax=unclassified Crossiella TaxID=2620835 RepID=UPI001FFFD5C8|nr:MULTISPECIES: class I SAM-dependent methyltransferase [unclassified Crossiella]MCK2238013.1 class I SAM-dependent methyltransferase [Crossiella sp. S99.2]MCK2255296.1 class I SAM-dependent methyltransferase [Crossiella sp. S99.1]